MPGEQASGEYKYWAFISYSHADGKWADWLHKALETYHVPKRLVGKPSRNGIVPKRPFPVFRDRDELPGSANLGDNLTRALQQSRYLIVICSPRAAVSQWVNQEVKIFKSLGREDRVLCLIVDGEPNATNHPELGLSECFPEAVRFWVDAERHITAIPTEPIAADVRRGKDGRYNAVLKLLAGILGVNFDDLKQRDQERAQKRMNLILAGTVGLLMIFGIMGFQLYLEKNAAIDNKNKAVAAQKNAEIERIKAVNSERKARASEKIAVDALEGERQAKVAADQARVAAEASEKRAVQARNEAIESEKRAVQARNEAIEARNAAVKSEQVAVEERRKAEDRERQVRRVLSASDFSAATKLVEEGSEGRSLAYLARALRFEANNESVAVRLRTLLAQRNWTLPKLAPMVHPAAVGSARFSADGKRIVSTATNLVQVWEAATGKLVTTMRHKAAVNSAFFSPDGKWVVSASHDKTAQVWDATTGQPVGAPLKHGDWVYFASFSQDGKMVATASHDRTARIWEAATGNALGEPIPHENPVQTARFNPDGKWLVTAAGTAARLFEVPSGKPLLEPLKHEGGVVSARFSPDGKWIVTASGDKTARVWDAASGKSVGEPMKHNNWVYSAVFSASGKTVVTASSDRTARVWEAATGKPLTPPLPHDDVVNGADFNPNANLVITASADRTTKLWDATTGKLIGEALKHEGAVNSAFFSPDGKTVLTASSDKSLRLWDAITGKPLIEPLRHDNWVGAADISPDGRWVATGSDDRTARIWELATGRPTTPPLVHDNKVNLVRFSPNGKWLVTASEDGAARLWEADGGKPVGQPLKHGSWVTAAGFSPDSKWVLTASEDRKARLWESATGAPVGKTMDHDRAISSASFSANGKFIVTASADQTARIWNAATGAPAGAPLKHAGEVRQACFSPDGAKVATASADKTARVWDAASGNLLATLRHEAAVNYVSFSSDSLWVVTASDDKTAQVWEAATGKPVSEPLKHEEAVKMAAFSPKDQFVLTTGREKAAHLWDAGTGKEVAESMAHEEIVRAAAFSPDGRFVVTAGNDKVAKVWMIALPGTPPPWLGELAEAVGGFRLSGTGAAEAISDSWNKLAAIQTLLTQATETNDFVSWGRWFLADRSTRTISPFASLTVPDYVKRRVEEGSPAYLKEALELQPDNALALAKLAKITKDLGQADFYSEMAVKYDPKDPQILWARAQVLHAQNRFPDAYPVMEAAIALEPKAVKTFGPAGAEFTSRNKDGGVSKGWLPTGWDDNSAAAPVSVTYAKLSDPPQAGATAIQMTVTSATRGQGQLRGFRFIGKHDGKYTLEGWARSAKKSEVTVSARQFYEPFERLADTTVRTTEQWKQFRVPIAPGKDFAAEVHILLPSDNTVDLAGVTLKAD